MSQDAEHQLQLFKYAGCLFGCCTSYWLLSSEILLVKQFDLKFLHYKDTNHESHTEGNLEYHTVISQFQSSIGYFMITFSFLALFNTVLRFSEITEYERE